MARAYIIRWSCMRFRSYVVLWSYTKFWSYMILWSDMIPWSYIVLWSYVSASSSAGATWKPFTSISSLSRSTS